jgi:glycosyltransferase involved in cell wall biosynthesis
MRIAFATPEYVSEPQNFDGGLANYLHRTALALKQMGHTPEIFVGSTQTETISHDGITVHRVAHDSKDLAYKFKWYLGGRRTPYSQMWWNLARQLRATLQAAHQVQAFDVIQYASYGATGLFRLENVPAVVRISSFEPLHRAARGITNPAADDLALEQIEQQAMAKADGVFGPSELTAAAVSKVLNRHIQVIESPFVLDTKPQDLTVYQEHLAGQKYLIFFGTVWRLKGADVIAQMLGELLTKHPDLAFVVVGKDFGSLLAMQEAAKVAPERFLYLGKLPHSQLYPLIANSLGAVLPSLYDNFPNTCLEAMALGTLVVGTKGTSFEQLITEGVNGFLSEPNNPQDLLASIERLLALTENQRQTMIKAALTRASQLAPEKVIVELINYYQAVIEKFKRAK